ncbi:MAG: hypothetical protein Kow0069_34010 [Promethearchaeota archaeon]
MMLPDSLFDNAISSLLDEVRDDYARLTRSGLIRGIIAVDQDAKVLAVDEYFEMSGLNYWELGSLAAALHGVARQGRAFFPDAGNLERGSMIYNNCQFFVQAIGTVTPPNGPPRELLLAVLADKGVNVGLIVGQMRRKAAKILATVESSDAAVQCLEMNEREIREHILQLKRTLTAPGSPAA